jgi:hypothetical protein
MCWGGTRSPGRRRRAQIASALRYPSSPIAQGALKAANYITAAVCKTAGGRPIERVLIAGDHQARTDTLTGSAGPLRA